MFAIYFKHVYDIYVYTHRGSAPVFYLQKLRHEGFM